MKMAMASNNRATTSTIKTNTVKPIMTNKNTNTISKGEMDTMMSRKSEQLLEL